MKEGPLLLTLMTILVPVIAFTPASKALIEGMMPILGARAASAWLWPL